MFNEEIQDYLATYGWENPKDKDFDFGLPRVIASPVPKIPEGKELRKGNTGDLIYSGVITQ